MNVTTEVAYCSFCDRVRNLRREEHQLGTFARTVVTCESCHRTLSSTMGVASAETSASEAASVKANTAAPKPAKPTSAAKTPAANRTVSAKAKPAIKQKVTKARSTKTK